MNGMLEGAGIDRTTPYGFGVTVSLPYDVTVERVRDALGAEGFGVGACNPPLAHQALQLETEIGLLLPYNVIVYATEAPNRTAVAALDPEAALRLTGRTDIAPLAAELKGRLRRVLEAVGRAI